MHEDLYMSDRIKEVINYRISLARLNATGWSSFSCRNRVVSIPPYVDVCDYKVSNKFSKCFSPVFLSEPGRLSRIVAFNIV